MNFLCERRLPAVLLVLLVGIIVYANTFHVHFVLDDERSIVQNPVIQRLDNYYANSTGYEFVPNRYVAYLTFALNYHFGGLDVTGYHAINLIIHLVAALLVYALLSLTFRTPYFRAEGLAPVGMPGSGSGKTSTSASSLIPLFAALLFVVHPVQTQAVTYIVQRMTSLATLFYLLSVVLYVKARLRLESRDAEDVGPGPRDSRRWTRLAPTLFLAGSTVSAVLAMKTKEISFTLPLAIALYEVFFFRGSWKRRLLYLFPVLATLPIVPLSVLAAGPSGDVLADVGAQVRVQTSMGRLDYLFTQFRVIVTYLRLLILPVNQNLDYDYPIYRTFLTPPVFLSFLLLAALVALAVILFWRTRQIRGKAGSQPASPCLRLIAFGIFWFFLTLAVESSIIPIMDVIVEHRLYLPSVGSFTATAAAFCLLAGKVSRPVRGKLILPVGVLVVLGLGFATWQRNHVWGDDIRLWQDVVAKSPNKGRAHNNLGVALEDAGRRREAAQAMARAIEVDPDYYKSYYNLADLYLVSGQPEAALPLLQTAIRLYPEFTEAYVELGAALLRGGRYRESATFLEQNLDLVGENAEARFYLGSAYVFLGNREAALRELEIVSRHDAGLAATLAGLLGMNAHGRPQGGR